jgi:hypothetical protein
MSSDRHDDTSALVKRETGGALAKPNIDFADHPAFHATVSRGAIGGAAGALVTGLLAYLIGIDDAGPLLTLTITTGVLGAISARGKQWLKAAKGAALGAAGGAAYIATGGLWPVFGAALLGASTVPVLASGESWRRMSVTAAVAGAFGWAGLHVAHWMQAIGLFSGVVPGPLATAAAGAAAGLFFGLASAPKHVARPQDPVESAYLDALQIKDGELYEVLARALTIHQSVRAELAIKKDEPTIKKLGQRVGDLAMRILRIVEQCRRIEGDLATVPAYELEDRISQLRRKAEAASDTSAKATYNAAADSLDQQRKAFEVIHRGRERVVARLHANVALLEKVRFSLLHLRSADAERIGGESSPLLESAPSAARRLDAQQRRAAERRRQNRAVARAGRRSPRELSASAERFSFAKTTLDRARADGEQVAWPRSVETIPAPAAAGRSTRSVVSQKMKRRRGPKRFETRNRRSSRSRRKRFETRNRRSSRSTIP